MLRLFFPVFVMAVLFAACKKNAAESTVELYFLKSGSTLPGKCQIDAATAVLADKPAVHNHDIKEYNQAIYEFKVTDSAFQKIATLAVRTPFAVTVNKQVIYYGIYSPPVYSSSCDHSIGVNVFNTAERKMQMVLGYPGFISGITVIDDQRNNATLLNALRSQGKLR